MLVKWQHSSGISLATSRPLLLSPLLLKLRAVLADLKVALRRLRRWPAANLDLGCDSSRNNIVGRDEETVPIGRTKKLMEED